MAIVFAWLITAGALVLGGLYLRARVLHRRMVRTLDVFPCTVRVLGGTVYRLSRDVHGRACRAEWMHDVLLLHRGFALPWSQPLAVRSAEGQMVPVGSGKGRPLGPRAVQLRLRLDDGSLIAVEVPAWAGERLAGPFLAVAAQGHLPEVGKRRAG